MTYNFQSKLNLDLIIYMNTYIVEFCHYHDLTGYEVIDTY